MSVCKVMLPHALKSLKGLGTWELQHSETVSVLPSAEFSASTAGLTAYDCLWIEVGEWRTEGEKEEEAGGKNPAPRSTQSTQVPTLCVPSNCLSPLMSLSIHI